MKRVIISCLLVGAVLQTSAQLTGYEVGDIAPNFTGIEPDGTEHSLYAYTENGKYVLIDFFAYWCGPCITNASRVQEFYEKYGCNSGNVVVLGNECDVGGSNEDLELFFDLAGLDIATVYPSWSGMEGNGADVCNIYSPAAYPTVALIGPDNKFINIDIWPISNIGDIEDAFPDGVLTPLDCATTTSLEELDTPLFDLYVSPNPASGPVTVSFSAPVSGALNWSVLSLSGGVVRSGNMEGLAAGRQVQTLEFGETPAGMYVFIYQMAGQQGHILLHIQ